MNCPITEEIYRRFHSPRFPEAQKQKRCGVCEQKKMHFKGCNCRFNSKLPGILVIISLLLRFIFPYFPNSFQMGEEKEIILHVVKGNLLIPAHSECGETHQMHKNQYEPTTFPSLGLFALMTTLAFSAHTVGKKIDIQARTRYRIISSRSHCFPSSSSMSLGEISVIKQILIPKISVCTPKHKNPMGLGGNGTSITCVTMQTLPLMHLCVMNGQNLFHDVMSRRLHQASRYSQCYVGTVLIHTPFFCHAR